MLRTIDRVLFLLICLLLQTACGDQEYTSNVTAYQDMPSNSDLLPDSVGETSLDYFRDCQTFDAVCNNICYAEVPWADTRSFCEQEDRLQELNAIPLVTRYDQFDASAFYDETDGIFSLSCSWLTQRVGEHESLQLDIYPQRPESPEKVDGFYYDLGESVTGAYYIMIHYPEEIPLDAMAALMERLPNFPKDTDVGEIKDVFASENE